MPNDAMVGADPQQLDALARDMKAAAERLASIQVTLRSRVQAAPWRGRRADTFRSDWDGAHRAALTAASNALSQAAEQLRINADDQRQTSSAATGGLIGPGGSAGSGAGGGGGGGWGNLGPVSYNGGVSGAVMTGSTSKEWSMSGPTYDAVTGTWTPAQAGVNVGAKYALAEASVHGSASAGPVKVSGQGSVLLGVQGDAGAKVTVGPGGLGAHAGAGGTLGATAQASATASAYGQSTTATGHVTAGVELKADADVKISYDHVKVSVELGAALGLGLGGKVSVDLNPMAASNEVIKHLPNLW